MCLITVLQGLQALLGAPAEHGKRCGNRRTTRAGDAGYADIDSVFVDAIAQTNAYGFNPAAIADFVTRAGNGERNCAGLGTSECGNDFR